MAGGDGDLASAELYDPRTTAWSPTGDMAVGRTHLTATRLISGSVLVAGGNTANGATATAELYP